MNSGPDQFWKILEPHHSGALRFCCRLAADPDEGADLYQDALVTAIEKIHMLRSLESFRPWLYRVIVNCYRNRCRSPWWKMFTRVADIEEIGASERSVESLVEAGDLLRKAFRAIDPESKAILVLFEVEGWTVGEISELYAAPEGTIKSRLKRTRDKMRVRITQLIESEELNESRHEASHALQRGETTST